MEKADIIALMRELQYRQQYRKIDFIFPDEGEDDLTSSVSTWTRKLYPKHLEFFEAGAKYKQRWFSAANRVGKTRGFGCEFTYHVTGLYPHWWRGKRFSGPSSWWVVGQSSETVQKILQTELLGAVGDFGSGLIPKDLIDFTTLPSASKMGVSVSGFKVKHAAGGFSTIAFKSVEQGVLAFTGTANSVWIDEPVPTSIYTECVTRTATGDNILVVTATPITGLTDSILNFCEGDFRFGEINKFRIMMSATWWDVPHLSPDTRDNLLSSYPPYQRDARSKGIPQLGQGAVFPISEDDITCAPFEIPKHFKKHSSLDVGWKTTAACFFATDPDTRQIYMYSEYIAGELTPSQHAFNIIARGKDIPVAIDPASHGRSQADGQIIFDQLQEIGLDLHNAINAREAGLWGVLEMLQSGQLKIFTTCVKTIRDLLRMSRDDKGRVIDSSSFHCADAFRYGVMTRDIAKQIDGVKKDANWFSGGRW